MKTAKLRISLSMAGVLLVSPVALSSQLHTPKEVKGLHGHRQVESEHLLVKFKPTVSASGEDNILRKHGGSKAEQLAGGRLGSLHRVHVPAGQEEAVLADLKADSGVEFAEYNELVSADGLPNDPGLGSQWHLSNISAPQAWDVSVGTQSVVVAILDSGVDPTHPDLVNRFVPGFNIVDNNTNTADIAGHGTAAAGSAVVDTNNGAGISSACWSCKIMPVRIAILQNGGAYAYYSTIVSGMQWAADHGAKILNISYGGLYSSSSIASAATYVKNKGGVVFGSAGNDSAYVGSSLTSDILFVSATNSSNQKTSWSNYGPIISLSAPGDSIYTTNNGGGYAYWSGTSFASPLAAGVAALMWASNPNLSNAQLKSVLLDGADDLGAAGRDDEFGSGKVNVARSLQHALAAAPAPTPTPTPAPTPAPSPTPAPVATDLTAPSVAITSPSGGSNVVRSVTVTVSASDNVGVAKVSLYVDGVLTSTSTSAPFSMSWNTKKSSVGSHNLSVKAWDAAGNVGTSAVITVNVGR